MILSMIKIDFVLNLFFFGTTIYFSQYGMESMAFLPIDIFFLAVILGTAYYSIKSVRNKNEKSYFWICLLRVFLELLKIMKCILILNSVNASFKYSPLME